MCGDNYSGWLLRSFIDKFHIWKQHYEGNNAFIVLDYVIISIEVNYYDPLQIIYHMKVMFYWKNKMFMTKKKAIPMSQNLDK